MFHLCVYNSRRCSQCELVELPTEPPLCESSVLLQDTEEQVGKSGSSSQGYGNKTETSLVMDESWKEGAINQAMLNPLASISGDADLGFVTIDLDRYGEGSLCSAHSSEMEACGGWSVELEEELGRPGQGQRRRWMTRVGQGLKSALMDLKLFFW